MTKILIHASDETKAMIDALRILENCWEHCGGSKAATIVAHAQRYLIRNLGHFKLETELALSIEIKGNERP